MCERKDSSEILSTKNYWHWTTFVEVIRKRDRSPLFSRHSVFRQIYIIKWHHLAKVNNLNFRLWKSTKMAYKIREFLHKICSRTNRDRLLKPIDNDDVSEDEKTRSAWTAANTVLVEGDTIYRMRKLSKAFTDGSINECWRSLECKTAESSILCSPLFIV